MEMSRVRFKLSSKYKDIFENLCVKYDMSKKSMFVTMVILEKHHTFDFEWIKIHDNKAQEEVTFFVNERVKHEYNRQLRMYAGTDVSYFINLIHKYSEFTII
jgi:hypothetical protein